MQLEEWIILFLVVVCVALLLLLIYSNRQRAVQSEHIEDLHKKKRSQSARYGRLTEQFMPFLETYPYDPHDFRFLGTPIDGVQFTEDSIVLIEFKSASSRLSERQSTIKRMVEDGKVRFETHRIS